MDFVIGEGRKFSICHLKIRTYSLHHTPFVTLWGHYSFGLLSTHSHHPSLNSFGESLSAAREDPGGLPVPGPHLFTEALGNHALRWASVMTHHTRGQGGSIRIFSKAGSKVFSPTSSLSVGTAQLRRWQSQAAAGHLTDHMLSGEWRIKKPAELKKSPDEIIRVPGCNHAWRQMYLWKP